MNVNIFYSKLEISLIDQLKNVLSNCGWVEKYDYHINKNIIEINNKYTFDKIFKILIETKFNIAVVDSLKLQCKIIEIQEI